MSASTERHGRRGEDGFSLVELLVAVTLLSVLMVVLFGGTRLAMRTTTAASAMIDRSSEIATAYDFLREALGNAQPLPAAGAAPRPPLAFTGAADRVDFVALPPAFLAPGGFQRLSLTLDDPGPHGRLLLRWKGLARGDDASDEPAIPPSVLLDRVAGIELAYFGSASENEAPAWHSDWDGIAKLPDLIRLRVSFADGRTAPELVVAPRLTEGNGLAP